MLSYTEENYLKAIYHLSEGGQKSVLTNELADAMNTKPASVTDMIKKLSLKKLIESMLSFEPAKRPSAADIASTLKSSALKKADKGEDKSEKSEKSAKVEKSKSEKAAKSEDEEESSSEDSPAETAEEVAAPVESIPDNLFVVDPFQSNETGSDIISQVDVEGLVRLLETSKIELYLLLSCSNF